MERFVADTLFTMADESAGVVSPGAVDIEAGRVVWSGPSSEAPPHPDVTTHRVHGVLMPGMVDIHCHTPMVLLRGAGEGLPVDRWLHEVMWPREAKLTPDDVRAGMRAGAAELLSNGITTTVEMYFHGQAVAEGAADVGLRTVVTAPVIEDEQLSAFGSWQSQIEEMEAMAQRWTGHDLVEIGLGPHAVWSVSEACMQRIVQVAAATGMLVHIHVAEQEWEDAAVREKTGMSAPAYLETVGLLDGRVLAAHGVWLSDDDMAIFGRHGTAVAHCPCSNSKHASGIARVPEMRASGIPIGIATDGPASHHRLDLFEEMRTAMRLARIRTGDAQTLTHHQALWMTTAGAADAIGRPDLGRLIPGARADMITVNAPSMHPKIDSDDDPVARVVFGGTPQAVTGVWVGGEPVVADHRLLTVDHSEVLAELDQRATRLTR